jgi:hypothetical protein
VQNVLFFGEFHNLKTCFIHIYQIRIWFNTKMSVFFTIDCEHVRDDTWRLHMYFPFYSLLECQNQRVTATFRFSRGFRRLVILRFVQNARTCTRRLRVCMKIKMIEDCQDGWFFFFLVIIFYKNIRIWVYILSLT